MWSPCAIESRESLWQERLLATLSLLFALIAVFMAVVGLHGLLSYDTTQRTREFGIRAAVGAQKLDVAELLVRDLLRILAPGLAARRFGLPAGLPPDWIRTLRSPPA